MHALSVNNDARTAPDDLAIADRSRAADLEPLLGKIEAHRADQGAGAEREHHSDRAIGPRPPEPERSPDDQRRRGQGAPAERRPQGQWPRLGSTGIATLVDRPRRRACSVSTMSRPNGVSDTGINLKLPSPSGMPMIVKHINTPVIR